LKPDFSMPGVELYRGDCLEILPTLEAGSVDAVVTDPPYGVNYDGGAMNVRKREKLAGDGNASLYGLVLPEVFRVANGPCYIWHAGTQCATVARAVIDAGGEIRAQLVWYKTNASFGAYMAHYKQDCEFCLYVAPRPGVSMRWIGPSNERAVWHGPRVPRCNYHPTQKPVWLMAKAIANHDAPLVLDPFMGSGTTGDACQKLGRKFIGIEIDPKYFEIAKQRIANAAPLFAQAEGAQD